MSGKEISEALSDVSDEMVEETAMTREEKRARAKTIWFRIAAMAATVIIVLTVSLWPSEDGYVTVPGILKVYAYDLSTGLDIDEQEGYNIADSIVKESHPWISNMNLYYGLPLTLEVDDERLEGMVITFDVSVSHCGFYGDIKNDKYKNNENEDVVSLSDAYLGKKFTIENGESIFWSDLQIDEEGNVQGILPDTILDEIGNVVYVDVIIKADANIVGYTIIELHHDRGLYTPSVGGTGVYLLEEGGLQEVTEEYVRQEIANCKAEAIK